MTFSVEQIIGKYVELRDRKAELSKKHDAEMQPLSGAMEAIENILMHKMNELGVTQLKGETGTAFKATSVSVQMKDAPVFKEFVFQPAVQAVVNHLNALGIELQPQDAGVIAQIIRDLPRWDVVDLRAGKKGIQEYQDTTQHTVPGVAVNSFATVNIRRA